MQIFAFAGEELLHQRHADALGDAAFNLTFDQRWIDSAADIVGRRRDGRTVRYSVADPTIRPLCDLVCKALSARGEA